MTYASTSRSSLSVRNLTHSFGPNVVLDDVSFSLTPGQRTGIVGPNGTGKSTLLKLLAGLMTPEQGEIRLVPSSGTVGYLPQEAERTDESVRAFLARRTGVAAAGDELDAASDDLASGAPGADDRYSTALDRFMSLGASDFDARIGTVVGDVGLQARALDLPMRVLSGGQAARAGLAALLLSRFDVYLLDEPTNDLDFDGLERLENFVRDIDGAALVVSHDRAFLARTINTVIELDEHSHKASVYSGSWDDYLERRAVARRHAEEAYAVNQPQRANLTTRMQQQKQWIDSGVRKQKRNPDDKDKSLRARRVENTEKQSAKISASERALERLEDVEKPWEGWELHLEFLSGPRSGDVVARLDEAVVERGDFRLGPVTEEVRWAERIAIVGPNGSGKSTFLNALLGRLPLATGTQHMGPGVIVGEIDQARNMFESDTPLVDVFSTAAGLLVQESRSLLAKFDLMSAHVERPARSLSPGERTRATLALLMGRQTNCLVLDEPTNHLDLTAIEQLETALDSFDGTVLLVTHDRSFLERMRITREIEMNSRSSFS